MTNKWPRRCWGCVLVLFSVGALFTLLAKAVAAEAQAATDEPWRRRLQQVSIDGRGGFRPRTMKRTLNLPPGLIAQSPEEMNYLKLHKCKDAGEVYSAAYLIHKTHLLEQFTDYNLTWVNCEMGSFIMMNQRADPNKNVNGSMTQSLDIFDFSVVHLSAYERLQRRWGGSIAKLPGVKKMNQGSIEEITEVVRNLKRRALQRRQPGFPLPTLKVNRTLAIMPFLGSDNGAGHSKLGNRLVYLQACFWSIYAEFPHIVVAVKSAKDVAFAKNESGLPFFDVMLVTDLPKHASLPVSTVQQTKKRILSGQWDFDYIYFTESDQILMMRIHDDLYAHIDTYPRRMLVPHRLIPYPVPILQHYHGRNTSTYGPLDFLQQNCCIRRQNCHGKRDDWLHVKDAGVAIGNIFGLQVPLGNNNFHAESYRVCKLDEHGTTEICP